MFIKVFFVVVFKILTFQGNQRMDAFVTAKSLQTFLAEKR